MAAAQAPRVPPMPLPDGPKQPVSGRVIDAETGRPVRGAQVSLAQGPSELGSAYSDGEGRFRIDAAPVGEWAAYAIKSGYARQAERLTVPAAQPLTGVELEIHRHAVITGRVLDHRDRPVVGARVIALAPRFEEGESVLRPAGGGQVSNDLGEFRIWNLSPGSHVIGVFPSGEPAATGVLRFASSGGLYPQVSSLAEAERIQVAWGQVREGVDFRLAPAAETRTVVRSILPGGGQGRCETCSLQVLLADVGVPVASTQLGEGNVAAIEGLPPGRYEVSLRGFDRATSSMWHGSADLDVTEAETDPLTITAYGEVPVRGRVVTEDRPEELRETPFRSGLRLMPPRSRLNLGLITRNQFANIQADGPEAPFELSVIPSEYELQLLSSGDSYIAGISLDGKPLQSAKLNVPPEGIPQGLTIRVRFDPGTVEGRLENLPEDEAGGVAPPRVTILARPADPRIRSSEAAPFVPSPAARSKESCLRAATIWWPIWQPAPPRRPPPGEKLRAATRRVEVKAGETVNVTLPIAKR